MHTLKKEYNAGSWKYKMTNHSWKIYYAFVLISFVFLPFHWQWTTGWLLGSLAAFIIYKRTENFARQVVSMQSSSGTYGNFAINYFLMAAVLVVSAVFPQYLNVLTCAIGLSTIKLAIIFHVAVIERGR